MPFLSAGGNLDSWPTRRPVHADIYVNTFASFPVSHLGERLISRGCLGISRVGPSLAVPSISPEITLGGLTAVCKQTMGLNWGAGERRHKPLPRDGEVLLAALGLCTCPCQPCWLPLQRSCCWGGSQLAVLHRKRWTCRHGAAQSGTNYSAKSSA